jgi:hypothetical protein
MADANTTITLEGIFKRVYDNRVRYIYPNGVRVIKDIPFRGGDKRPGESFNAAITLVFENGFTYQPPAAGVEDLEDAAVGQTKRANVDGFGVILRSQVDYESIAKASTAGPRAFIQSTKHIVANMANSFRKRQEIEAIYGQAGLGIVESVTTTTMVITAAEWAPGVWAGAEGAALEVFNPALTVNLTTGATLNKFVIASVDFDAREITVTLAEVVSQSVIAGSIIFWKNALVAGPSHRSAIGIHAILSQSSGSLFGIDPSAFTLWLANQEDAGGAALTMDVVQAGVSRLVEKGGGEGRLCLYISTKTWVDLIGDLAALRRYQKGDGNARYEAGAEAITFWTQSGPVEIKPGIFVKGSYGYLLDLGGWSRIGAQDFAFGDPAERQVFHRLESKSGYDARAYANQAIFSDSVGHNTLISGIVNSVT